MTISSREEKFYANYLFSCIPLVTFFADLSRRRTKPFEKHHCTVVIKLSREGLSLLGISNVKGMLEKGVMEGSKAKTGFKTYWMKQAAALKDILSAQASSA